MITQMVGWRDMGGVGYMYRSKGEEWGRLWVALVIVDDDDELIGGDTKGPVEPSWNSTGSASEAAWSSPAGR